MTSARAARRREHRAAKRHAKLVELRQVRNLRSSPTWATVVQALAFVRKELVEILRQPRLLLLLVVGPFALLVLFGAGYREGTFDLRTEFVGPEGSVYETALAEYGDELQGYVDPQGFTSDEAAATRRLEDGELDAVVVFPDDALDQILAGDSAAIRVLHEKLDPFQRTAIEIAARLAVQEVNTAVLGVVAGEAQSALAPIDDVAAGLTAIAAELSAAVAAGDPDAVAAAAGTAVESLTVAETVVAASAEVVARLGGDAAAADVQADLATARATAEEVAAAGGENVTDEAATLAASLDEVAAALPQVSAIDPEVLVRPFAAAPESVVPVDVEPIDYFAPSTIVLLLQHLALTFAALSLVRDRELGLFELLRVGPLSSIEILAGKTIAYLLVGVGVGAALIAAAVGLLGVPFVGSVVWVAVAIVAVLLASLALGMVMSMISGSETQAVQYAMLSLLAGMFFGGFILDVDDLAVPIRYLSYGLPVTYGINMMRDVMFRGVSVDPADLVGLGALVVVYGTLAVLLLRRRLRTG